VTFLASALGGILTAIVLFFFLNDTYDTTQL
jgi:hypothetical protein